MSERGEAGVSGVLEFVTRDVLLRSERSLTVWRGSVVMHNSGQAASLMIPSVPSSRQKLRSMESLSVTSSS